MNDHTPRHFWGMLALAVAIIARHSSEISDYGINDTSSLEKDITAVVSLSFAVE